MNTIRPILLLVLLQGASGWAADAPAPRVTDIVVGTGDEVVFDFRSRIATQPHGNNGRQDTQLRIFKRSREEEDCAKLTSRVPLEEGRVGVVLSGGVSKGLAFIGALSVMDEIGFRIDRVTGTSMGAVVGAFHASGYAPQQLYRLDHQGRDLLEPPVLGTVNWRTLFSDTPDPAGLSLNQQATWGLGEASTALPRVYQGGARTGQNLGAMLGRHLLAATAASDGCFDNLYVPFSAMSTNVSESRAESLYQGSLALSVRASLSFPVMLTPTLINGHRYLDGGMLNNYPVRELTKGDRRPDANGTHVDPIALIVGFDVSDETVKPLRLPTLLSFWSVFDGIGAISDGVGAAIGRETQNSRNLVTRCGSELPPIDRPNAPCLLNFKLILEGGFTDFTPTQIDTFVRTGRHKVLTQLCDYFRCPPSAQLPRDLALHAPGSAPTADIDLQDPGGLQVAWLRRHLQTPALRHYLRDPQRTARRAADNPQVFARREWLQALLAALDQWRALAGTRPVDSSDWNHTLEGVEFRHTTDRGLLVVAPTALQADDARLGALVTAARAQLIWLLAQLERPLARGEDTGPPATAPAMAGLSSVRVVARADESILRAVGWHYRSQGLITSNGLTERGTLDNALVHYWGVEPAARATHVRQLKERFRQVHTDDELVLRQRTHRSSGAVTVALSNGGRMPEPKSPNVWIAQAFARLTQTCFDVRYRWRQDRAETASNANASCTDAPSLPKRLEDLQEHYYTNAAVEYVRMVNINRDAIELAEKNTHRLGWGSLYGTYHYDYLNKHSFGAKYVYETDNNHWLKPTRVVASAAVNEPTRQPVAMHSFDLNLLFFPRVNKQTAMDLSLNPYRGKRYHRIGDDGLGYGYSERGVSAILSQRPLRFGTGMPNMFSTYVALRQRDIGDVESDRLDAVRALLRDPDLGAAQRRFTTASIGLKGTWVWDHATLSGSYQLSAHRANGTALWDGVYDVSLETALDQKPDSALYGLRLLIASMKAKRDDPRTGLPTAPPPDELYSMGGYFPLAERSYWARRRIDYLGADLNALWGTEVTMFEARRSVWRLPQVTYFAPLAKVQLDVLAQHVDIGFRNDPGRRWRTAAGLVFSAYSPPLASLKARLSIAYGGERWADKRFHSSIDVVF